MGVDSLIRLWDKGGVPLVMIVLVFALAWFIGRRGVKAFDGMAQAHTNSMNTIATAVQSSSAANVVALGGLVERFSHLEGKIEGISLVALAKTQPTLARAVVDEAIEDDNTPVGGGPYVPMPVPMQARASAGYRSPARPPTNTEKKNKP